MVKSIYSYRYFLNKKYEAKWTEPILNLTLPYIDIFVLIGNVLRDEIYYIIFWR